VKPRFTDHHRFPPGGYVKASKTDVAATFRRIRREMAEQEKAEAEAEAMQKVRSIKKGARP